MHHLEFNKTGPLQIFYDLFEEHMSLDDNYQFYSNSKKTEIDLDQFLCDLDQFQNQYHPILFIVNGY